MASKTYLSVMLGLLLISSRADAGFFHWIITHTESGNRTVGQNKLVRLPDHKFVGEYAVESKDWACRITSPNGFNNSIGEVFTQYQEGVRVICTLKSNKAVIVRDYGACTKWTKGPNVNSNVENSGPSLSLEGPSGSFLISATCSADSWKSQGAVEVQ